MLSKFRMALMSAVLIVGAASCKKETTTTEPTDETGTLTVQLDYVWAMSLVDFNLNETYYQPMTGDTLTYTTFKHYLSNFELLRADGTTWTAEESYHLANLADPSSLSIDFSEIPAGDYVAIRFLCGVDSARNVAGSQTGALDPANEMFWSWNSGYIMIKAEGTSPQSSTGSFAYHLGGFTGEDKAITEREINFGTLGNLSISKDNNASVVLQANPARLFHSYGTVANGATIHMPNANAGMMAQDFNTWIRVTEVHNN